MENVPFLFSELQNICCSENSFENKKEQWQIVLRTAYNAFNVSIHITELFHIDRWPISEVLKMCIEKYNNEKKDILEQFKGNLDCPECQRELNNIEQPLKILNDF
jgi:hypothetical protein